MRIGEVKTFPNVKPDKQQALKPIEEAAEVFGAWQRWDAMSHHPYYQVCVLEECADAIIAIANLAASFGCDDLAPYIERATAKNEKRGRYDCGVES